MTFSNTHKGRGKIIKTMPDGGSTAGWKFEVYDSNHKLPDMDGSQYIREALKKDEKKGSA